MADDEEEEDKIYQWFKATKQAAAAQLSHAVFIGDSTRVEELLEEGADPNEIDLLQMAIFCKQTDILKLLLDKGADPNQFDLLEMAIHHNQIGIVKLLLDKGADPNQFHRLAMAVTLGHTDIVRLLLNKGADPKKFSVLNSAVELGQTDIARLLLDKVADQKKEQSWFWAVVDRLREQSWFWAVVDRLRKIGQTLIWIYDNLVNNSSYPIYSSVASYTKADLEEAILSWYIKRLEMLAKPNTNADKNGIPLQELSLKDKRDIGRLIRLVKEGRREDLATLEAHFSNSEDKFGHISVNPLLIVAAHGSPATVQYVHRWSSKFDWNSPLEIPAGVFEGILHDIPDRKATPLYVATFLKKEATTESLIKYSDEKNIAYCMSNILLSVSMEKIYMVEVGERLKLEYSSLNPAVVLGHQETDSDRVFMVYSTEVIATSITVKEGIGQVMLTNPYKVDEEAVAVSDSKDFHCEISKEEMYLAKQTIESNSDALWRNHSNLNIISVRSKGEAALLERRICIVLYCSTKGVIPLGEIKFPKHLNFGKDVSFDIDVREGYFDYCGYETRPSSYRHEELKMGCNIGTPQGGGTLGPFVRYNDCMSFLTCAHVLFDANGQQTIDFTDNIVSNPRYNVTQPAPSATFPAGAPCGFVQRAIFNPRLKPSVDVAVVEISDTSRRPTQGKFANDHSYRYTEAGFDELPMYNSGSVVEDIQQYGTSNMVVKFGSETHLTKGGLIVNGAQVRPLSTVLGLPSGRSQFCMSGQYEVAGFRSPFFELGDSGSAVFMLDGTSLHCIGMAIGKTSHSTAVVTPIGALLNALGGPQHCSVAAFR